MGEAITLDGLRKFVEMKEKGEKLPENYKELVRNYINFKFELVEKWKQQYEKESEQLKEALSIAAFLDVPLILRGDESE